MRTPAQFVELRSKKAAIGYVDPPADLVPKSGPYDCPAKWDVLCDWFDEHTTNGMDAVLCFFADRCNCSIGEAYVATDGWGKRRVWRDDDGVPMSFN